MKDNEMVRMGNGQKVAGRVISFNSLHEPWAEYQTEEGVVIRIRTVVTRFVRLAEPGMDGGPQYLFQSKNVIDVQAPESEYVDVIPPPFPPEGTVQ